MQRGRYQLYKHKRAYSMQKSQTKHPQLPKQTQSMKPINHTSNIVRKISIRNPIEQVQTAQSQSPFVTCKSGCAYDINKKEFIWKNNSLEKRQIASLTKIMTCWVVIQYIRSNNIVPEDEYLIVSKRAAEIGGTSAELAEGDKISIWDLLHGLMLPSGNDAALCLAQGIGKQLSNQDWKQPVDCFVTEMNRQAAKYNMTNTNYVNVHGLSNRNHKSTVEDQVLLIKRIFEDNIFRILIDKKIYFCNVEEKNGWSRQMFWETTNKLLHNGFNGIKTGSTPQAGPCLASWYKKQGFNILIVTLSSSNADTRFKDSVNIIKWIKNRCIVQQQK